MQKLYDRADIYDLIESPERFDVNKKHWELVFAGKQIDTLLAEIDQQQLVLETHEGGKVKTIGTLNKF